MDNNTEYYHTMTDLAIKTIKENILHGKYAPGSKLLPNQLEKDLNLGRVAIREALKFLAGSGLVETKPNKGAFIAKPLDPSELKEIYEVRLMLECKAFELSFNKIKNDEIEYLETLNQKMQENLNNFKTYFELNRQFHMLLYQISGWRFLCSLVSQIYDRIAVFRSIFPYNSFVIENYINQHCKLINAIKKNDYHQANETLDLHLREGYKHMIKQCDNENNTAAKY